MKLATLVMSIPRSSELVFFFLKRMNIFLYLARESVRDHEDFYDQNPHGSGTTKGIVLVVRSSYSR